MSYSLFQDMCCHFCQEGWGGGAVVSRGGSVQVERGREGAGHGDAFRGRIFRFFHFSGRRHCFVPFGPGMFGRLQVSAVLTALRFAR